MPDNDNYVHTKSCEMSISILLVYNTLMMDKKNSEIARGRGDKCTCLDCESDTVKVISNCQR
jgi:hypothetical protein